MKTLLLAALGLFAIALAVFGLVRWLAPWSDVHLLDPTEANDE